MAGSETERTRLYPDLCEKGYRQRYYVTNEEKETLKDWEHMMACCMPWAYVWFKEGCGVSCFINTILSSFPCTYCVGVCHACSYIEEPPKPGSPCYTIARDEFRGSGVVCPPPGPTTVVIDQPIIKLNNYGKGGKEWQ